ncbi:unnamed protein product [Protopolystoma xenopodis]|uniref:Uncharacterized protein n=1 Tax=Protopolystoma xenopodis TaxID=117903 RepID=A0A3S5B9J6_9PLAT|nr:unnamed protein product [Protopolystoma xenopodis]
MAESFSNPGLWVDAAVQNAFDTGAGMALFTAYSAYFTRRNGVVRYGTMIPAANNIVSEKYILYSSLICGITIFGTVFSSLVHSNPTLTRLGILKIMKYAGPGSTGLTFTWMPVLFSSFGSFGRILCGLFFLCLSFAGVTSLISNVELTVMTIKNVGGKTKNYLDDRNP